MLLTARELVDEATSGGMDDDAVLVGACDDRLDDLSAELALVLSAVVLDCCVDAGGRELIVIVVVDAVGAGLGVMALVTVVHVEEAEFIGTEEVLVGIAVPPSAPPSPA